MKKLVSDFGFRLSEFLLRWIYEPGMVNSQEVRLVMNSLRRKGVDIIRRSINELALAGSSRPWLVIRNLRKKGCKDSLAAINDSLSLNDSYASVTRSLCDGPINDI